MALEEMLEHRWKNILTLVRVEQGDLNKNFSKLIKIVHLQAVPATPVTIVTVTAGGFYVFRPFVVANGEERRTVRPSGRGRINLAIICVRFYLWWTRRGVN